MCFSAPVSFLASGGLAAIGGATIRRIRKRSEWFLVAIPFLFSIQQLIEGLQWIVPHPSFLSTILGYAFLLFAFLWWPTYMPMAVFAVEKSRRRKKILKWFILLGAIGTVYIFTVMLKHPLNVNISCNHILYNIEIPSLYVSAIAYVVVMCGSCFVSSDWRINVWGALGLASFIISIFVYTQAFTSVWCFFAAILSAWLFISIPTHRKRKRSKN